MTRFFVLAFVAAVFLAAPTGGPALAQEGGVTVGDKYYPPCTAQRTDNCVQVREMKREGMMKKEQMGMEKEKMGMEKEGMMRKPGIPRGCSPATTPCQ